MGNFVDRDPHRVTETSSTSTTPLFQKGAYALLNTDVSMSCPSLLFCSRNQRQTGKERHLSLHRQDQEGSEKDLLCRVFCNKGGWNALSSSLLVPSSSASQKISSLAHSSNNNLMLLGDAVMDYSCRWSSKFYGQVTFGPRGFAYPSSRWLARRFRMKKHKILKRFRFRRYKLAAIANLPFAKMIRVGMLPELKSSKTRKGDAVDLDLSTQLVQQARSSTGGKVKGRRSRPKSKYQV